MREKINACKILVRVPEGYR